MRWRRRNSVQQDSSNDRRANQIETRRARLPTLHGSLSQREFQIFCKLAGGQAVSQIADELHLSVKTVSTYRTRLMEKMSLASNSDLTYYAIKHNLIA